MLTLSSEESAILFSDCCEECNAALVAEHMSECEEYECAEIYVRKMIEQRTEEEAEAVAEVLESNPDTASRFVWRRFRTEILECLYIPVILRELDFS